MADEGAAYFVVMGDEDSDNQSLFKANLLTGEVAFSTCWTKAESTLKLITVVYQSDYQYAFSLV